jgi:hypothetical protein
MIKLALGVFLFSGFACLLSAQGTSNELMIRQLLQRYTETYGGLRDADRLASISIQGTQKQGGVDYGFHLRKKRPASMRYQLKRGDTSLTTIYNGRRGWLLIEKADTVSSEELSGARLELVRQEARFESPLYRHLEKPENKITFEGRERIGLEETYVLRVEEPDSPPSRYFIAAASAHVLRIDRLNEEGEVVFQTFYRDYREVEGYPFAYEVENRIEEETVSITRVESISVNPGLLSFYFQNPGN